MARRLIRWVLILGAVLVAIPLVLVPVYSSSSVRPISTLMLADHFTFQPYDRQWVPLDAIAPVMMHSVVMSEDGQFCAHDGVDWTELRAVVDRALEEGSAGRGASTIPMQTVKNVFLWGGRSFVRKGLELPLALYADAVWSKGRMMEIYLNVAEWGEGIYGVESASRFYFNRPAKDLTARQAALLAASLPAPLQRDPANPSASLSRIADRIQARARGAGAYVRCLPS